MSRNISFEESPMVKQQILLSAQTSNILVLTSVCNVRCLFCSHKQNPPEVKTYYIKHRALEDIKETLEFISPRKRIVIGESVTKINEGEPFAHPQIEEILLLIRKRFPKTKIQITTNGSFFNEQKVQFLKRLDGVEINYSLNSSSLSIREKLMKDASAETSINGVKYLKQEGIPFHGSLVAMPMITGWDDLENTIRYFDEWGAETTRVFIPGFTRLAPLELRLDSTTKIAIEGLVARLKGELKTPITLEPQEVSDLQAVLEGVIKASPADLAGLKQGDVILAVNDLKVFSRVEAFQRVFELEQPKLLIERNGREEVLTISKASNETSGLVMAYDLARETFTGIKQEIKRKRARRVLILTSEFAFPLLEGILTKQVLLDQAEIVVATVISHFFGGSIGAAGLLVVDDFLASLREMELSKFDIILLPAIAFDNKGFDLAGKSYLEIEEEMNKEVVLL